MVRNSHGYQAEEIFLDWVKSHGERSVMWRFKDSRDFSHAGGKVAGMATNNPADFAGCLQGRPCFVEVKGTINPAQFPKANAQNKFQRMAGMVNEKAGLPHYYFIYSFFRKKGYLIRYHDFWNLKSTKWEEIEKHAETIV